MRKIVALEVLDNYRVRLSFDDGVEGIVGFSAKPRTGVFAAWRDYEFFPRARIGDCGELVWDEQIDLCPDALWQQVAGRHAHPSASPSATYA
jgi:hypothetical protein